MRRPALTALCAVLLWTVPASALEVRIKEVGAASSNVRTTIELRDLVPDRFKHLLDDNGTLHLRVQAELWEVRPVWDRLVYPAIVRAMRMTRATTASGVMSLVVDLGKTDRIADASRYYVHVIATVGTLAERDAEDVGDAVFGRESETNTLGSLGKLVVRTAMQMSDYLQSVSAEAKGRKLLGRDLIRP